MITYVKLFKNGTHELVDIDESLPPELMVDLVYELNKQGVDLKDESIQVHIPSACHQISEMISNDESIDSIIDKDQYDNYFKIYDSELGRWIYEFENPEKHRIFILNKQATW